MELETQSHLARVDEPLFAAATTLEQRYSVTTGPIERTLDRRYKPISPSLVLTDEASAFFESTRCIERTEGDPQWDSMIQLQPATTKEMDFLEEMLCEAFCWDPLIERQSVEALRESPEFSKLLAGWGRRGDRGIIAKMDAQRIGAAWFRLWTPELHSYGFLDAFTPEIAIAVKPEHRSRGVGRGLLSALIQTARADHFSALSLSVNPRNPARQLYESVGFRKVGQSGTSWTLLLSLSND